MAFLVYCRLFVAFSLWRLYLLVNCVFTFLRYLRWRNNGISSRITQNRKAENYGKCVQVLRSVFLYRLDDFIEARESDFILVHDTFVHPEYILRDDVSLYTITKTDAIFVQERQDSKAVTTYDFYMLGQLASTDRVIKIPLDHFNTLAESTKRDDAKIIFLQNQSRCGSTLLVNIFKETGRCVAFSDPHCYNTVVRLLFVEGAWTGAMGRRIFRNVVYMMCKPFKGLDEKPLAYLIKPTFTSTLATEFVQDAMPEAVQFFLYREPIGIAKSMRRTVEVLTSLQIAFYLPKIPCMLGALFRLIGYCDVDIRGWTPKGSLDLEFGYRAACLCMYRIQLALNHGVTVHSIRYRDLVHHTQQIIQQCFRLSGIPVELVEKAQSAINQDSQSNSPISRESLNKVMPVAPAVTSEFLEIAREMSMEFGVAGVDDFKDDSFHLPGSLLP